MEQGRPDGLQATAPSFDRPPTLASQLSTLDDLETSIDTEENVIIQPGLLGKISVPARGDARHTRGRSLVRSERQTSGDNPGASTKRTYCQPLVKACALLPSTAIDRIEGAAKLLLVPTLQEAANVRTSAADRQTDGRASESDQSSHRVPIHKKGRGTGQFKRRKHKHLLCAIPGCQSKSEFGSKYELKRHIKDIHHLQPANGDKRTFKCASEHCADRDTVWRRLDKFRVHIRSIHPDVDEDGHVEESTIKALTEPSEESFGSIVNHSEYQQHTHGSSEHALGPASTFGRDSAIDKPKDADQWPFHGSTRQDLSPAIRSSGLELLRCVGAGVDRGNKSILIADVESTDYGIRPMLAKDLEAMLAPLRVVPTGADNINHGAIRSLTKNSAAPTHDPFAAGSGSQKRGYGKEETRKRGRSQDSSCSRGKGRAPGSEKADDILPCVFSDDILGSRSRPCTQRYNYISRLTRHHGSVHHLYYCKTCLTRFHDTKSLGEHRIRRCQYRCLRKGRCDNYGQMWSPSCSHYRKSGQKDIWNWLHRLAHEPMLAVQSMSDVASGFQSGLSGEPQTPSHVLRALETPVHDQSALFASPGTSDRYLSETTDDQHAGSPRDPSSYPQQAFPNSDTILSVQISDLQSLLRTLWCHIKNGTGVDANLQHQYEEIVPPGPQMPMPNYSESPVERELRLHQNLARQLCDELHSLSFTLREDLFRRLQSRLGLPLTELTATSSSAAASAFLRTPPGVAAYTFMSDSHHFPNATSANAEVPSLARLPRSLAQADDSAGSIHFGSPTRENNSVESGTTIRGRSRTMDPAPDKTPSFLVMKHTAESFLPPGRPSSGSPNETSQDSLTVERDEIDLCEWQPEFGSLFGESDSIFDLSDIDNTEGS